MCKKLESANRIDKKDIDKKECFLFVTANKYEKEAFLNYFFPRKDGFKYYFHSSGNAYYLGTFGKYPVVWVHLRHQGSYSEGASKETVKEALTLFRVIATFSVGIAFGIESKNQKIGDVLVSNSVFPYELMRVSENETVEKYELRDNQRKNMPQLSEYLKGWEWTNNTQSKHFVGTFLCGEKLIDSKATKEKLLNGLKEKNACDVIGGDMETTGIEQSHREYGNDHWITVKGISDWADGTKNNKNKNKYQKFAADNAVKFLYGFFCSRQLENIFRIKNISTEKYKCIDDIKINGVKLFYYRNKKNYTIYKLADCLIKNRVKSKEYDLKNLIESFENVDIEKKQIKFKKTNYFILKKLETILNCKGELSNLTITKQEKFIFKNNKKHFCIPVTNVKAVVFDFDGTLTIKNDNKSCWQRIWSLIGDPNNLCVEYYNMFKRGEINHKKWCDLTLDYFKKKNLTKCQVEQLANEITLIQDCEEVFKILKEKEVKIYICSGSIYSILEKVLGNLKNYIEETRANNFVYENDIIHEINGTKFDFKGKREFVEQIAHKLNLDIHDIAFVGNSDNDIYVGGSGARTILINPFQVDPGIQAHWMYDLEKIDSLKNVLPYLLPEAFLF